MKISVFMGTYNRAHLLARSLECYASSTLPPSDFELVIVDDWSTDFTDVLIKDWARLLNIIYMRPFYKTPGTWRDSSSFLNQAIRACSGGLIIGTHPEVMPGRTTLEEMIAVFEQAPSAYIAAKPYYLSPEQQEALDSVDWRGRSIDAVRELPNFYTDAPPMAVQVDYSPRAVDAAPTWESWVFGGMARDLWERIGGLPAFEVWGAVDMAFLSLRKAHGIATVHPQGRLSNVVHQNHDLSAPSPRDMNAALNALQTWKR